MGNYETFVLNFSICDMSQIVNIDCKKLDMIRPFCTRDNVDDWIEKARVLSRSDLAKEIQEFKKQKLAEKIRITQQEVSQILQKTTNPENLENLYNLSNPPESLQSLLLFSFEGRGQVAMGEKRRGDVERDGEESGGTGGT